MQHAAESTAPSLAGASPIRTDDIDWRPRTAHAALVSLETLIERLRERDDARSIFLDIYAVVTRKVIEILELPDHLGFLQPAWLSRLTGRFAEEALVAILDSLEGRPIPSAAWRFAAHYPERDLPRPYQSCVLGISAHVNHDLAQVVFADLVEQSPAPTVDELWRYHHDFERVNKLLELCIPECLALLEERYDCASTRRIPHHPVARRALHATILQVLVTWRRRSWLDVLALLEATSNEARAAVVARIDHRAGRIAQALSARGALLALARRSRMPFRLRVPPARWPGVRAAESLSALPASMIRPHAPRPAAVPTPAPEIQAV